ncbi:tetratricopeptide repeat protein [Xanthobacter flavus]|uniref:tetratricopeptide repeat protein n=1 Tax=Xanthobacter flavus TaxID=281 RepID=UPI00372A7932
MTTAIHFRTCPAPALDRDRKRLLRDIALGHLLATSIAALTLAAGPAWAQSPQPSQAPQAQQAPQSPQATPAPQPPELTGAAWVAADRAYAAQREKRYADAVTYAREALKLRPDAPRLWLLLMDALDAQGKTAEAVVAGNAAIAAGITDQALTARVRSQSRVLAQEPSVAANKALEASNPKAAIEQARKAVALVPDDLSYRVLLVYTLLADGQLEAADKAASEAIQVDPQSFLPRTLRGYVRMRLGKVAEAEQDFDTALKDEVLTGPTAHDARLVMADAAIAAGHPQRAIKLLEPVEPDAAVQARLRVARAQERNPKVVPANAAQTLPVPFQKCIDTPYGPSCSLIPATTPPGGGGQRHPRLRRRARGLRRLSRGE